MTTYLISFDLDEDSDKHVEVYDHLEKEYDAENVLSLSTTWIVNCNRTDIGMLHRYLLDYVSISGNLLIIPICVERERSGFSRFVRCGEPIRKQRVQLNRIPIYR